MFLLRSVQIQDLGLNRYGKYWLSQNTLMYTHFNTEWSWVLYILILAKLAKFHNAKDEFERSK